MRAALLDAGPVIAYLLAADRHHHVTVDAFERCAADGIALSTTWEAVSEAFTYLRYAPRTGQAAFHVLEWAWESGVVVIPAGRDDHKRCRQILRGHPDLELSYADALLLSIAERVQTVEILTVDGRLPAVRLSAPTVVTVL